MCTPGTGRPSGAWSQSFVAAKAFDASCREGRTRASGGRVGCALRYVEESWRERGQSPFASAIAPGGVRSVVRLLLPAVGPASELVLERDTGAHLAEKTCRGAARRGKDAADLDGCATLPRKVDWRWVPRRGAARRCSDEGRVWRRTLDLARPAEGDRGLRRPQRRPNS